MGLQHNDDIQTARKSLFLKRSEEPYLNLLNVGECILKVKNRIQPCHVRTPLVPIKKGQISDYWLTQNVYTNLSGTHDDKACQTEGYLPGDNIEANEKPKRTQAKKDPLSEMLLDIFENPLSNTSQRYRRLSLNPKYGHRQKQQLINQGYIRQVNIRIGKGRISLYDLTSKGWLAIRDKGHDIKKPGEGVLHLYWKTKVAGVYKKRGYKVEVEKHINGRADIIATKKDKRIAIEIETGKSNILANIQRNMKAGFDEMVCVATDRTVERKIRKLLVGEGLLDKVVLKMATGF